jgi:protein TonB
MNQDPRPEGGADSMFHLLASAPPARGWKEATSLVSSFVIHAALAAGLVWATLAVGEEVVEDEEVVTIIEVTEEVPPPPPPPPEPEAPPPPEVDVPKGFQTLSTPVVVPPDIPPPGQKVEESDFSGEGVEGGRAEGIAMPAAPVAEETTFSFTPYTVKPKCRSGCSAEDILRHVPPFLKRSGVECELTVGIRVDTQGAVTATDLLRSSGNESCDRAAEEWARTTQWTTAYNRDQAVAVWIAQPVSIQTQ